MKKYTRNRMFILLFTIVILCMVGCGSNKDKNDGTAVNNGVASNNGDISKTICINTGIYNAETDAQSFFIWGSVAQTKNGFYFFDNRTIMFYDFASKQVVPLCNRPNCTHDVMNSPDCNAILNENDNIAMNYDTLTIQFYKGNLYISGCDKEGYDSIYKISQDGSTREQYMKLYRSGMTQTVNESYRRSPTFCIHRGYVYYINEMEETQTIRRMEMGKDDTEIVYEPQGERATVYRMKAYGDYLVFQTGNFAEDMINIDGRICAYNIKTSEIGTIVNDVYNEYHVFNGKVYYTTATEIRCYDMETKEDVAVIKGNADYYTFCIDEDYIYTFQDGGTLRVYSHDGTLKCTVQDKRIHSLYYVNDGYLLGDTSADIDLGLIEVSDFADGTAEWEIFVH